MTTSALNRLTVIGSCLLLAGCLGGLLLYAIPVMTGHGWQIILYWILPATLTGAALIGFQAWQTPSDVQS
jgi:hypothetical protein